MKKKRILFVDDEPDILKLVAYRLKKEGYEVITAEDGEKALNLVHQKPDLILLDLALPGIDGYGVCKRIKADLNLKDIPIIFFTASASDLEKLSRKVKTFGVQGYIAKPFSLKDLFNKIKKYI